MLLLLLIISVLQSLYAQEVSQAILLYEDQKELNIDGCYDCWNFLTLKKKLHSEVKKFEDFTICYRLNILSYRTEERGFEAFRARTKERKKIIIDATGMPRH